MSNNNDFLSGMAVGGAIIGIPLITIGVCARNEARRDKRLIRAVFDETMNNPEKTLKGLELGKGLSNMAEFRVKAQEFLSED